MNGKFLLITVLSLATLCLAGPTYKTEKANEVEGKIAYRQQQQQQQQQQQDGKQTYFKGSSKSVEDILARWCQSSDMSSDILTESFKQLSATLKDANKRQLEQLTDTIIVRERFCQDHPSKQVKTTGSNSQVWEASIQGQEELIKDVYLDALVASESGEAVEQLVRAIDSGKVDKIRSNYYLTLLAISVDGSDDSAQDVAQKLTQSLLSKQHYTKSGAQSGLLEAIERQKMFAATSAWSKKIQHQQEEEQTGSSMEQQLPESYKQKIEQLVEAIYERYIKPATTTTTTTTTPTTTTTTSQQIADRSAALKAIANIPCYALPIKSVQYLLQLALNKHEQVTARQTAIEALKSCSQQQEQQVRIGQQLKQLALQQTSEPIEVRIAAYRQVIGQLVHSKATNTNTIHGKMSQLEEIVKYIQEESRQHQDVQFVAYVVSHLENVLKINKQAYEEVKQEKPQLVAQIRVVSKRMDKYQDMRKYSRNYQLEQSLAKLDTGLILDGDIIFEQADVLPKMVRLNVSMPIMGKTVELIEIAVRQNHMQREFLQVLKPLKSTKVNMESIDKVVSGIKKVANQIQQQQQQPHQRNQHYQTPEADLAIKVDGCTVMYVSLEDFKPQPDQQQLRSQRSVGRFESYKQQSTSGSFVEELLELLKKSQVINRGIHFHLNKRLGGVIDIQTVLTGAIRAESRVRSLGVQQGTEVYELLAQLEPRFAFETVIGLTSGSSSTFSQLNSGKKLLQRVSSQSNIGLRMKYKQNELIELTIELPQEEMELFKVESQLVEQVATSSTGLPIYQYSTKFDQENDDDYYNNQKNSQNNKYTNDEWSMKSQQEQEKLMRFYGQDVKDFFSGKSSISNYDNDNNNSDDSMRKRRSVIYPTTKPEIRKLVTMPKTISKLTGLQGKLEFVASPKNLSGMMRLVVKKIDPKMMGYRMLIQGDSQNSQQNAAYTIAVSTPVKYGQEVQQERLVQLRLIKDISNSSNKRQDQTKMIRGELITPVYEPVRFMLAIKDDDRQKGAEFEFKFGASGKTSQKGGKFEIGYQKQQQQQQQPMMKQQQQFAYKPYVRLVLADRPNQPIEMYGLVSVVRTPKTQIQYELQVPQELVQLFEGHYHQYRADQNKIKGKLTIQMVPTSGKYNRAMNVRRDLKSNGEQMMKMIEENDITINNDLDIHVGRLSMKCLTHMGSKPEDEHLVVANNIDYIIFDESDDTSRPESKRPEQYRFDFEYMNKQENENTNNKEQDAVEQVLLLQHSSSRFPITDMLVKLEHTYRPSKLEHDVNMRYQFPTERYIRQVKSSPKILPMVERLSQMGTIEYGHKLQYYSKRDMQLIARILVTPIKLHREIALQVQSQPQQQQQKQQRSSGRVNTIGQDQLVKTIVVIKDKMTEREDLNALVMLEQQQKDQSTTEYSVLIKAELANRKHTLEVSHDVQHQQQQQQQIRQQFKNMFRMVVDKQAPTTFEYVIREKQTADKKSWEYTLEGILKESHGPQRGQQVRARSLVSLVNGFEFQQQVECPEKELMMALQVSQPKESIKFEVKSSQLQMVYSGEYNKQLLAQVNYRPQGLRHQTRIHYDERQQVLVVESEQSKYEKSQWRIESQLSSPIDWEQFERVQKQQRTRMSQASYKRQVEKFLNDIATAMKSSKQIGASFVKAEFSPESQAPSKLQIELVPQEERFQMMLANEHTGLYHKTQIGQSSSGGQVVIKSETRGDKEEQLIALIEAILPTMDNRKQEDIKVKIVVPRLYNVDMEYDSKLNKFASLVKKGPKFERTLKELSQRGRRESSQPLRVIAREIVTIMDKMDSQKVIIDGSQYPQVKLSLEINESPVKKLVMFGADVWTNQEQMSSMALQTPRYVGESKWQRANNNKMERGVKWESEVKDLVEKVRYTIDGALQSRQSSDKSYLNMDWPQYKGRVEYEPLEERIHLSAVGKAENSQGPFQLETKIERLPMGRGGQEESASMFKRFVRRAQIKYEDKNEEQKHSFELNPYQENVKVFSERQAKNAGKPALKHLWWMRANLNSHRGLPSSQSEEEYERSYVTLKHNDDLDASFTLRPFASQAGAKKSQEKKKSNNNNEQDEEEQEEEQRFAHLTIKSRAPRSVYEHETKVWKSEEAFKAWMKHLSRDELKALVEGEFNWKNADKYNSSKKTKGAKKSSWKKTAGKNGQRQEEEPEEEAAYDQYARIHAKSDKHGHALWEHKWGTQGQSEPTIRQDRMRFDLDLADDDFQHESELTLKRPASAKCGRGFFSQCSSKRQRRSLANTPFEYLKQQVSALNKMEARLRTQSHYQKKPVYQMEANWNGQQQQQRASNVKLNAFQYKSEVEYLPNSHAHLELTTPEQARFFHRYERVVAPSHQHLFTSKQASSKGDEVYSFQAQLPASFQQYELHPFHWQQQLASTSNAIVAPTKIVYSDALGKKVNIDLDLARQNKQKRAAIFVEDPISGYEHLTKWGYATSGGQEQSGENYFKSETKSARMGGRFLSFDIIQRNSNHIALHLESPLIRAELTGERAQRQQHQLRLKVESQSQTGGMSQQQRRARALMGAHYLPEQFYHETEVVVNERDQYYKLNTQTSANQRQLVQLQMEVKPGQEANIKLASQRANMELKVDQQVHRVEFHADCLEKRLQHDTTIQLTKGQRHVYAVQSQTRYLSQQLADITAKLTTTTTTGSADKIVEAQLMGRLRGDQYLFQMDYDRQERTMVLLVEDKPENEVHSFKANYNQSDDTIQANYWRQQNTDLVSTMAAIANTGLPAFNGQQKIVYHGEGRLNLRDLSGEKINLIRAIMAY